MITSPDAAHRRGCGCGGQRALRPEPPRSFAELMALGIEACRLDADAETLALILPLFGRPSASTLGPYALLNERGAYGPAQLAGRNPRRSCARLALRLAPGHGEVLIRTAADPGRRIPAALHLFDASGAIVHRTEIAAPEDLVTLEAVTRQLGTNAAPVVPPVVAPQPFLPSLPAIRQARALWPIADRQRHFDDLVVDGGKRRASCLPHLGKENARRVDPRRIGGFLQLLARAGVAFTRSVIRPGCVQSFTGMAEILPSKANLTLLHAGASLMALDLSAVAGCWLTARAQGGERSTMLELYDSDGAAIAVFDGDETLCVRQRNIWDRLAATL